MARPQMGDERREQILEAFEKCVIRKGVAKTTLSDVAEESELPRSLVRYFVGNRADMVDLLIDRMIERAEDGFAQLRPKSRPQTTHDFVDFLFENTFANDVSNNVVGELWYMAERDESIQKRLAAMYGRVIHLMVAQMETDGIGASGRERRDAANIILSLVYGQTSFRELGMSGMASKAAHAHARTIIDSLTSQPKKKTSNKETVVMKKYLIGGVAAVIVIGAVAYAFLADNIDRASTIATLFSGAEQYENFNRMDEMFPINAVPASTTPYDFPDGEPITLPETFTYKGQQVNTEALLSETDTSALLVLKDGKVVFERYMLTGGREEQWLSMSVAKSFISALVGIAVEEGFIKDIEAPISDTLPELAGSAYDGVRIKDVLQMSSGAAWNEDYSDPESDINRFGRIFALGGSLNEFMTTLERKNEPGTVNHYNSTDTQVLGALLVKTTGRTVADYMTEKLWQPIGAESDAFWLTDSEGMEMAFGGFNATARDYAKLGELFRNGGKLNGKQIVPADWVKASITPDAPHLLPGANDEAFLPVGYGYQWWILDGDEGEYSGIGVYNQFVYVNPTDNVVIVKLSANSNYAVDLEESSYREYETFHLFREIADRT